MTTGIGTHALAAAVLGFSLSAGCALSHEPGGDIHGGGSTEPLLFTTCEHPLHPGETLECAHVDVPLDYTNPDHRRIELYVGRVRASVPATAQLWLMEGGPGGSSIRMLDRADALHRLMPDVDVYAVDHRGVGMSTPLVCPSTGQSLSGAGGTTLLDDEVAACGDELESIWGADLALFSTTNAARDIGEVVARTHRGDQRTFLYGVSYGTYWLERYLQLYPSQADGVILDSILAPGGSTWPVVAAEGWDRTARAVLAACAADASCASHFTGAPIDALERGLAAVDAGTCAAARDVGLTGDMARAVVALVSAEPDERNVLPGLAERLGACRASDAHAFATLAARFGPPSGRGDAVSLRDFSRPLQLFVMRSEIWDLTTRRADYDRDRTDLVAFYALRPDADTYEAFPHYVPDGYHGLLATSSVPMLMLQGELDLQTPLAQARIIGDHFTAAHQTFVVFPRGVHDAMQTTASTASVSPDDTTCAGQLLTQFVRAPTGTLDTSCVAASTPWAFESSTSSTFLFGEPSMWGDGGGDTRARLSLDASRIAELRARFRDRLSRGPSL